MVLKDLCSKNCERIYTIDFSLFLKLKSLDMLICLSVPNCNLVEISLILFTWHKFGVTSQF